MSRLVFVYGTLMQGMSNNGLLKQLKAEYVGEAELCRHKVIDTHGTYPYMIQSSKWNDMAYGELWQLPTTSISKLNALEVPAGYMPVLVDVTLYDADRGGTYIEEVVAYLYMGLHMKNGVVVDITNENEVSGVTKIWKKKWSPDNTNDVAIEQLFIGADKVKGE